ncbi:MAG: hypothetical protein JXR58_13845 [Bacteroidales bacterium]|nr:hypothetical protein [Bacteroidales bacterium]
MKINLATVLFCFILLNAAAQKEKGYTSCYYAGAGASFNGAENYSIFSVGTDNLFPSFYDYKFSGQSLIFGTLNKENFHLGLSYYFKPFYKVFLRNPYFFSIINLQGGYIENNNKAGGFFQPEYAFILNGKAYEGLNFRFKLGISYAISTIKGFDIKQPGVVIQLILGYNKRKNIPE